MLIKQLILTEPMLSSNYQIQSQIQNFVYACKFNGTEPKKLIVHTTINCT